jgi:curved DNA-binding protein
MTHYETLGVSESANADEIKKAYRKLASQHHPDKGGDTKKFQEIQTAYDTLADADRRQRYDMERQNPGGMPGGVHFQWHGSPGGPDLNTIFQQFGFGGGDPFAQFRHPQSRRNKDLRIDIPLPLVTTLQEQTKTISVQTTNGHRETVEVKIPKGVTNGTTIKYSGLGDNLFETLARGDLYVQINVHPAENFHINGIDLYTKTSVNCLLAITGGETIITGLDNKTFSLTIPPGIQPGVKFRISGQGLYQLNSNSRGDLYVELAVSIPQNLTQDQLHTIKSIMDLQ